jgi:uncharacterized protein YecE (DUF72 family)
VPQIPIYAYFNNDIGGHAPRDATRFRAMTVAAPGKRPVASPSPL